MIKIFSIGIDIGGSKIATGIVHEHGEVFYKNIYPTPKKNSTSILELVANTIVTYMDIANREKIELCGIGIGSAGQVSYREGTILSGTTNINDWNNVNIFEYLSKYTKLPIFVDNDANAFAVAEHKLGSGKGNDDIVCLTLGTGIGGGVISGGKVIRGEWGGAAELGHITVNMYGPDCNCGSKGCIEAYASGSGIANRFREKLEIDKENDDIELDYYRKNPESITSKQVFQWYDERRPIAIEVVELAIQALSFGIINMIHTFNPTIIALGGGLMEGRDWIVNSVKERIDLLGMPTLVRPVEIRTSTLGPDAGIIGAALLVWIEK